MSDYERAYEVQKDYLDKLSVHAGGELLSGLGEGHLRIGNQEKARGYFERVVTEVEGFHFEQKANAWLENPTAFEKSMPGLPFSMTRATTRDRLLCPGRSGLLRHYFPDTQPGSCAVMSLKIVTR